MFFTAIRVIETDNQNYEIKFHFECIWTVKYSPKITRNFNIFVTYNKYKRGYYRRRYVFFVFSPQTKYER